MLDIPGFELFARIQHLVPSISKFVIQAIKMSMRNVSYIMVGPVSSDDVNLSGNYIPNSLQTLAYCRNVH